MQGHFGSLILEDSLDPLADDGDEAVPVDGGRVVDHQHLLLGGAPGAPVSLFLPLRVLLLPILSQILIFFSLTLIFFILFYTLCTLCSLVLLTC